MNTTRRTSKLLAVATASALVIAACGSDDAETDGTDAPEGTTVDEGTTAPEGTTADEGTTAPEGTPAPEDTTAPEEGSGDLDFSAEMAGLTIVDDSTFTIELAEADPEFPLRLSYSGFSPLPAAFYDDPGGFEEAPIGNGPFMMDGSWEHDVAIRTVPYPDYAGPDAPQISSLTFNLYEDSETTGYLDLQAGAVDVVRSIPTDQLATAPGEFGDRYAESPDTGIYYYGFPTYLEDQYPLDLRRALSMAVDRELINEVIGSGGNIPAFSLIPGALPGARDTVCENWTFNPDAARTAFEAFGGLDALGSDPLIIWFNTSETHAQFAEAIANQWREVLGIDNVQFENLEFSEYLPKLDGKEITGVFRLGWGADYLSPLNFLEPLYAAAQQPPVGSNTTFTENAAFEQALADGKAAVAASGDLADGIPFYNAAEDELCDTVPTIPIHFGKNKYAWNDTVTDVFSDAFGKMNYTEMGGGDVVTAAGEPEHLTPTNANESEGIEVLYTLFRRLVEYNQRTGVAENMVADSIVTDDGGQTYTVTIADGWTFHDGTAVTSESFVKAWNFAANGVNAQQNNGFFSNIVGYAELNAE